MKHILFDLDGTLLPMRLEDFSKSYFGLMSKRFVKYGLDPNLFFEYMSKGVYAMIKNDGSKTNEECFKECFSSLIPFDFDIAQKEFDDYYKTDFVKNKAVTYPSAYARKIIDTCHEKGMDVFLLTNPLFPRCATLQRIEWAGLKESDFVFITTYENSCYCKPNLMYYKDVMEKFSLKAEDSMMVGNDVGEDMVAGELGIKTYLVNDFIENRKNLPVKADNIGTLADLYEFVKNF